MALDDDLYHLARNPCLAVLEPEALKRLTLGAKVRSLRSGDVLFRRDELSHGGFFLRSGSIALDPSGHDQVSRIVEAPALIGDMAMITQTRRPATAVAREPSTVIEISRAEFQRILGQFPRSAERLRQLVATRLRQFVDDLDDLRERTMETPEDG